MRMRFRRSPMVKSRAAMFFMTAFALLFLAIGALLVLFATWSAEEGDTEDMLLFGAFGSTFCTAAVFTVFGTWRDRRAYRRDLARKEALPEQPWLLWLVF